MIKVNGGCSTCIHAKYVYDKSCTDVMFVGEWRCLNLIFPLTNDEINNCEGFVPLYPSWEPPKTPKRRVVNEGDRAR